MASHELAGRHLPAHGATLSACRCAAAYLYSLLRVSRRIGMLAFSQVALALPVGEGGIASCSTCPLGASVRAALFGLESFALRF